MNYYYQKVNPQLSEYVRAILVFDNNPDSESSDLPLVTKGMSALVCKGTNRITLFGQSVPDEEWSPDSYQDEKSEAIIVFFFKPFVLGAIFKVSAQTLKEKRIELNLWNAHKSMALAVQLTHSGSTPEKVDVLAHFISTQIESNQRDCKIVSYSTDMIMQNPKTDVLSQLVENLHLTERTFQRIFKKYVGITPVEYRRICQHYFAFSQLKGGYFEKLSDIAFSNGYFDQSHYIRSFKEFTDTTPNEYLQSGLDRKK